MNTSVAVTMGSHPSIVSGIGTTTRHATASPVDDTGLRAQLGQRLNDERKAVGQIIPRSAEPCDGEHAFDLTVVHSYSRFFREAFEQEFYLRKLAKHSVRVVSITQPVGDETEPVAGHLVRRGRVKPQDAEWLGRR